jgi:hypothetical protein
MGVPGCSKVKRRMTGEDRWRAVVWIIVHERAAAFHRILHVGQCRDGPLMFLVAPQHAQAHPITLRHHD